VAEEGRPLGAICHADRVLIMENAWYSVISPESCAAILWRDAKEAPKAAEALKLTARDLLAQKVVDAIVPEPEGGAHKDPDQAIRNIKEALLKTLEELKGLSPEELYRDRYRRFRTLGAYAES
ncbi:acetyl-CoA carboxylase carboxyl transferase subunit alpha, partial [Thermus scotoductus]